MSADLKSLLKADVFFSVFPSVYAIVDPWLLESTKFESFAVIKLIPIVFWVFARDIDIEFFDFLIILFILLILFGGLIPISDNPYAVSTKENAEELLALLIFWLSFYYSNWFNVEYILQPF